MVEIVESHGGAVRTIVMPGGAMDLRLANDFVCFAEKVVEDREVRAVIVRGTSSSCSFDPLDVSPDPASALARIRVPTIVLATGPCLSVGLEIALAGDIRVGDVGSQFGFPDVAQGRLPCWGGTQRLPRVVGTAYATSMMLLGEQLDAAEALRRGLIHDATNDVDAVAGTLVDQFLGVGPLALELAKEAVHRGSEVPLRDGLRLEGDLNTLLQTTSDRREGLAAFFAKRPPDFAGR